jgi:hypothetical protein
MGPPPPPPPKFQPSAWLLSSQERRQRSENGTHLSLPFMRLLVDRLEPAFAERQAQGAGRRRDAIFASRDIIVYGFGRLATGPDA